MKRLATIVVALALAASGIEAQDAPRLFKRAMNTEMVDGDLSAAIEQYRQVVESADRALAAQALLRMAACYEKLGDPQAGAIFERVGRDFPDQTNAAAQARAALSRMPGGRTEPEARMRRVMEGTFQARVSPDGRWLAHNNRGAADALILRDLATGAESVVERGDLVLDATFSPDSARLAYGACTVANRVPGPCEVRVAALAPGRQPVRRLITDKSGGYIGPVDWSPDGRSIAVYVQRQADRVLQFALLRVADGGLQVLKSVAWGGTIRGFFSPDGRDIAIDLRVAEDAGKRDVHLIAADASREVAVVTNPGEDYPLGWSPDGKHLLFASDRTGAIAVWSQAITKRAALGAPVLVKANVGNDVRPAGLTRSGALHLGLRSFSQNIEVASVDLETARELGPPVRPIRAVAERHYQPAWSPDGKSLAYVSVRRGENILGIRSGEPAVERELPLGSELDRIAGLTWAADGGSVVAWGRDLRGRYGLFRIDASNGKAAAITFRDPGGNGVEGFSWSPDGTRIYFRSQGSIYEREIGSGTERSVLAGAWSEADRGFGPMSVSPDGRWISTSRTDASTGASVLLIAPVAGGTPRELLRVNRPEAFEPTVEAPRWTPDGRAVMAMKLLGGKARELWLVPVDGTAPRRMAVDTSRMASGMQLVRLHPGGRQLAYLVGDDRGEIWAFENILPR